MPLFGFGTSHLGTGRYGYSDWPEEMLWNAIPEIYRRKDAEQQYQPLRAIVDALKPLFEDLRVDIAEMTKLRDPYEIPIGLLDYLGYDFDQVTDENKSESLRRSAVANCPRLYLTKGTDKGYAVLAGMEGFLCVIHPEWESPCRSGRLTDVDPAVWVPHYDDAPADMTDRLYDDFFPSSGSTVMTLRFTDTSTTPLVSVDSVSTENRELTAILGSIGATPSSFDLSTAVLPAVLPIYAGLVSISVRVEGETLTITDDGSGSLSGSALPSGGTIDYITGAMTGITSNLDAGSDISIYYTRFIDLTLGSDYTVDLTLGQITLVQPTVENDHIRVSYTLAIPCDVYFPDRYSLFPITLYPPRCTICRSHFLALEISKIDPTATVSKLLDRVFYYKPIHVVIALREIFEESAEQVSDSWNDLISFIEPSEQVSESTSVTVTVNPAAYWIIDDTSDTFDAPNFTAIIA